MFCAIYVARMIFDIFERKRWIRHIKMFSLIKAENVDFVGKIKIAVAASIALIAIGLGALFFRGRDNLDIDFRGGTAVSFRFREQPPLDEVRKALAEQFQSSISLEELKVGVDSTSQDVLYRLRTVETEVPKVAEQITQAFASPPYDRYELVQQHAEFGEPVDIPEAPAAVEGASTPPAADAFAGGRRVDIKVREPVFAVTMSGAISEQLEALKTSDGAAMYTNAADLLAVEPADGASGKANEFVLKVRSSISGADIEAALAALERHYQSEPLFEEKTTFDAAVAGDTKVSALTAILISNLAIIFYLWFRFQHVEFGIAAVIAVMHDVCIILGLVALGALASGTPIGPLLALTDFKIDLSLVAAFMTIIGYSLNDTIVVFDRIREVRGKNPALTPAMVNKSLNETLSRTLLTSSTTLIVLAILYFMGGEGVHGFSYCMFLGIIVGTFSSIYVASPALIWLSNRSRPSLGAPTQGRMTPARATAG
jgi:SecD/SecF fusion protein